MALYIIQITHNPEKHPSSFLMDFSGILTLNLNPNLTLNPNTKPESNP